MLKKLLLTSLTILLMLLVVLPCVIFDGGLAKADEIDVEAYDATISYETCLMQNGSFYKAYALTFGEEIAYTTKADGTLEINASVKKGYDDLKAEVKSRLGALDLEVSMDDKGNVTILEYYEGGYTDMYLDYGYTGYDYQESDSETETGFLFTTYIDTDETLFSDKYKSTTFGWMLVRLANVAEKVVDSTKILRQYVMTTKYLNSYDTDADVVQLNENSGTKSFCFYVTPDNLNRTYTIKNRSINLAVWYVLGIAVAGIVAIATVIAIGTANNTEETIYG